MDEEKKEHFTPKIKEEDTNSVNIKYKGELKENKSGTEDYEDLSGSGDYEDDSEDQENLLSDYSKEFSSSSDSEANSEVSNDVNHCLQNSDSNQSQDDDDNDDDDDEDNNEANDADKDSIEKTSDEEANDPYISRDIIGEGLYSINQINSMKEIIHDNPKIIKNAGLFFKGLTLFDDFYVEKIISFLFTEKYYTQNYRASEAFCLTDMIRVIYRATYNSNTEAKILDCITFFLALNHELDGDSILEEMQKLPIFIKIQDIKSKHKYFIRNVLLFLKYYTRRNKSALLQNEPVTKENRLSFLNEFAERVEKTSHIAEILNYSCLTRLIYFLKISLSPRDISTTLKIILRLNCPRSIISIDTDKAQEYLAFSLMKNEKSLILFNEFLKNSEQFKFNTKILLRLSSLFGVLTKNEITFIFLLKISHNTIADKISSMYEPLHNLLDFLKKTLKKTNGSLTLLDMTNIITNISTINLQVLCQILKSIQLGAMEVIKSGSNIFSKEVTDLLSKLLFIDKNSTEFILLILEILEIFNKFKDKTTNNFYIIEAKLKEFIEVWLAFYSIKKILPELDQDKFKMEVCNEEMIPDDNDNQQLPLLSKVVSVDYSTQMLKLERNQSISQTAEGNRINFNEFFILFSQKCQNLISSIFSLQSKNLHRNESLLNTLYQFPWILNMNTKEKILRDATEIQNDEDDFDDDTKKIKSIFDFHLNNSNSF